MQLILFLILMVVAMFSTHIQGELPLVISIPHGGKQKPAHIPDRVANGSIKVADAYTIDLGLDISQRVTKLLGASPHVVINHIARSKVDVNRSIQDGAETQEARQVWESYHHTINTCIEHVLERHNYGLLIDIHGHGHPHGMIELGYLVYKPDLIDLNDDALDAKLLNESSIQSLASRIGTNGLLRGKASMGHQIESMNDSIKVVPSPKQPFPRDDDLYFRGGYITQTYHRGNMDVIQIEVPRHLRFDTESRHACADAIARSIVVFLQQYYGVTIRSKL